MYPDESLVDRDDALEITCQKSDQAALNVGASPHSGGQENGTQGWMHEFYCPYKK